MDTGLREKVAVVTGATSNIGRAIALGLATEGVRLLAIGRDGEAGQLVVKEAKERGAAQAAFMSVDLLKPDSGELIRDRVLAEFGAVDILVNGVGGNAAMGFFADSDPASWNADIEITLMTLLRVTRAILPTMIERGAGSIINIGSTAGVVGDYMLAIYSASKGAVHTFTKVLAKEVGRRGVRVNCVAPYSTASDDPAAYSSGSRFHPETGFFTKAIPTLDQADLKMLLRSGPLDRTTARPEEVASAVVYLASERAAFITGQIVRVDGGVLL